MSTDARTQRTQAPNERPRAAGQREVDRGDEYRSDERKVYTDPYESSHFDNRSITDLIRELRDESTVLLREEIALAKTEMNEKVSRVTSSTAVLVTGAAVAHLGLIFLLLAASAGLERFYDSMGLWFHGDWVAPLVVGLIVGIIGTVMLSSAKKKLSHTSLMPKRTMETLRDDKNWVKEKMQ